MSLRRKHDVDKLEAQLLKQAETDVRDSGTNQAYNVEVSSLHHHF